MNKIYTYPKPLLGPDGRENWADCKLIQWKSGMEMRQSAWHKTPHIPLKRGHKITFDWDIKWCFTCGSVYNWINNQVYGKIFPDNTRHDRYILRCGDKHCAGASHPKRDIWVDGDYWYYIRNLKTLSKKVENVDAHDGYNMHYKFTFIVDSYPDDVPAIIKQSSEQDARVYMSEQQIGDFKIIVSHADHTRRKWLDKELRSEMVESLKGIFARSFDKCKLEF